MRVLVASDFHGKSCSGSNLENFLENGYDLLVILGDLTQLGAPCQADELFNRIDKANVPIFSIPGNCDPKGIVEVLESRDINLHSKIRNFNGLTFVGLGGSNKTPFSTPFELTESEIWNELDSLTGQVEGGWILVTHVPPYGTQSDLTSDNIHAGSKSVWRIVSERKPLINFCAHIHEARGIENFGRTTVVNAGPISEGYAAEFIYENNEFEINLLDVRDE